MTEQASPPPDAPAPRGRARVVGALLATTLVLVAGGGWAASRDGSGAEAATVVRAAAAGVPQPRLRLTGLVRDRLPWQERLQVTVRDGVLTAVTATGPDGEAVGGALTDAGTWRAAERTVPSTTYHVSAEVRDRAGSVRTLRAEVRSSKATDLLRAALSPGDDRVVGVGQPVVVRLDRPVVDPEARATLVNRLEVRATPAVDGAWRWISSTELHYRGPEFWQAGSTVRVVADLEDLPLPDGVWGSGRRTSTFTVGPAITSVVDTRRHTMTVRRDGTVLRVMKASMGKPGFATRNGTFLVLEKFEDKVMDSDTLVLPPGEAAYRTAVEHAVRISYSGTFTHSAPWSVEDQGRANVSHGCINLSPADAEWFHDLVQRGDVVEVIGSTRGPLAGDPGSMDWNMSFEEWRSGS